MHDLPAPHSARRLTQATPHPAGVRGWLLVLCLMLTIIGPLISAWLMASEYTAMWLPHADFSGLRAATLATFALTIASVAFGIYAGLRLWLLSPNAVKTAKLALLAGLAVDILTTAIDTVIGYLPALSSDIFRSVLGHAVPGLIFFTLCFAYLNKSNRVLATYSSSDTAT